MVSMDELSEDILSIDDAERRVNRVRSEEE
jgi:hypothetical protein